MIIRIEQVNVAEGSNVQYQSILLHADYLCALLGDLYSRQWQQNNVIFLTHFWFIEIDVLTTFLSLYYK